MSTIELYYMTESPPCRTVEMVADMIDVNLNKHYLNLAKNEHLEDHYVKLNPRHKVPFIIDGDVKIGESRAIIRYLLNKYKPDDDSLYPKDPELRAYVDELLDYELGSLYPAQHRLLMPIIMNSVSTLNKDDEKNYRDTLQYLDDRLGYSCEKKFLIGDHLTIADISLVTTLTIPDAFSYSLQDFRHLTGYIERVKVALPNYKKFNDQANENMKNFILIKRKARGEL